MYYNNNFKKTLYIIFFFDIISMFNFKTMLKDCKTFHDLVETCKKIDLKKSDCFDNLFDKTITEQQKQNVIKFSIVCQLCNEKSIEEAFGFDEGLNEADKLKKIISKLSSKNSLAFKNKKELSFKSTEIVNFINNHNLNNGAVDSFSFNNADEKEKQKQNIANNLSIILFGTRQDGIGGIGQNFAIDDNYESFENLIETSLRDATNDEEKKLYEVVNFYYKKGKTFKKNNHKENIVKFICNGKNVFSKDDLKDICAIDKDSKSSLSKLIKNIDLSNDLNINISELKIDLKKRNILSLEKGIKEQTENLVFGFLCHNYNTLNDDNKKEINDYVKKQFLSINNIDNNDSLIDERDIKSIVGKISENYKNSESIDDFIKYINNLKKQNISFGKIDDEARITPENEDTINNIIYTILYKNNITITDQDAITIGQQMTIKDVLSLVETNILNNKKFDEDDNKNNDIKDEILKKLKFKLKVVSTKDKELYNNKFSSGATRDFILSEEGNKLLSDLAIEDTKKQLRTSDLKWKTKTQKIVNSEDFKDALNDFFEKFKNNEDIELQYDEQDHKLSIGEKTFEFGEDNYGNILNEYLNNIIEQAKQEEESQEPEEESQEHEEENEEQQKENQKPEENQEQPEENEEYEEENEEQQKENIDNRIKTLCNHLTHNINYKNYIKPYILSYELSLNLNALSNALKNEEKDIENIKNLMQENVRLRYSLIKSLSRNIDTRELSHPISERKLRWYVQNAKKDALDQIDKIENAEDATLNTIGEKLLNNDIKINGQQIITKKEIAENPEKPDEKQVYYEAIPLKEIKKERKKTFKLKTTTNRKEVRNDIINELKQLKNIHKAKQQENPEI